MNGSSFLGDRVRLLYLSLANNWFVNARTNDETRNFATLLIFRTLRMWNKLVLCVLTRIDVLLCSC